MLAPASAHEVTLGPELLGGHDDLVVPGDKGYLSAPLAAALRDEHALYLLTPPRRHAAMPVRRNRMGASRYGTGCGILPRGRPWKR